MPGDTKIDIRIEIDDKHILDCKQNGNEYTVRASPTFIEKVFLDPFFKRLARFHAISTRVYTETADVKILHKSKERMDIFENAHDILCAVCRMGVMIGTATIVCETSDEVPLCDLLLSLPPKIGEIHIGMLDVTQNDVPSTVWTRMPYLNVIRVLNAKGLETEFARPNCLPCLSKRKRDDPLSLFHKNPIDIRTSTATKIVVLPDGENDEGAVTFKIPCDNQSNLIIRAIPHKTNPLLRNHVLVEWPNDEFLVDSPYQSIFRVAIITRNAEMRGEATENTAASIITGMELYGRVAFVMK